MSWWDIIKIVMVTAAIIGALIYDGRRPDERD
jgi:hypothetical protein